MKATLVFDLAFSADRYQELQEARDQSRTTQKKLSELQLVRQSMGMFDLLTEHQCDAFISSKSFMISCGFL